MKRILMSALISASIVACLFCTYMLSPSNAEAAPRDDDAFQICDILNADPTHKGLDTVAHTMMAVGLSGEEAGETLHYAVTQICPQFYGMTVEWAETPTPPSTEPMGPTPRIGGAVLI